MYVRKTFVERLRLQRLIERRKLIIQHRAGGKVVVRFFLSKSLSDPKLEST